jgi:prolyl-tRNA synthetase
MKDLYTFDSTTEGALVAYKRVRQAYDGFFNEFRIPFLTAEAASGEMGGDLSHEYHFCTTKGEDNIVSCNSCDYVANEELAQSRPTSAGSVTESRDERWSSICQDHNGRFTLRPPKDLETQAEDSHQWIGVTHDRSSIVQAFFPREIEVLTPSGRRMRETKVNSYAIKRLVPDLDLSVENPRETFKQHRRLQQVSETKRANGSRTANVLRVFDMRYGKVEHSPDTVVIDGQEIQTFNHNNPDNAIDLVKIETGDPCPRCNEGTLKVEPAVELGHTFHLGTRYSTPLNATIAKKESPNEQVAMQMGCHGIGISRLIAAVADSLADSKGLNWPRVIAPFEAVVISGEENQNDAVEVYDALTATTDTPIDTLLDDRDKQLGWKLKDADLIGYPVIVVVGRDWKKDRKVEVQCRRLGLKELVPVGGLKAYIEEKLQQL